jgi:multiple sugar transport system permease protein
MIERKNYTQQQLLALRNKTGPIAQREKKLAYFMLAPTIFVVLIMVLLPVLSNFWVSAKEIGLSELRQAKPVLKIKSAGTLEEVGDSLAIELQLRSIPPTKLVEDVILSLQIPLGLTATNIDPHCLVTNNNLTCEVAELAPRKRLKLPLQLVASQQYLDNPIASFRKLPYTLTGDAENVLTSFNFSFANFEKIFSRDDFYDILWVSFIYTIFGTGGALVLGLFAALLLNTSFKGRTIMRGLLLFPYVSPVIAVAFTWVFLFDPFSGAVNSLLIVNGVINEPINFFGSEHVNLQFLGMTWQFPLALTSVIVFEAWRYFPLAFLFILARIQSLSSDMYEAADMDGATPLQKFWHISMPQLVGILSTLFLLRFIWTFNKFDDIFLLTGGASGTRTLTVDVYEQGFALSNLGLGAAVAVVIFFVLAIFVTLYFRFSPKEEGM